MGGDIHEPQNPSVRRQRKFDWSALSQRDCSTSGNSTSAVDCPGAWFQDDNARPHRARVVTDFLQQQNVQHMDWPAYSSDLSPIEHAWDELGRQVRSHHVPAVNLRKLAQRLVAETQAIPQRYFQRLMNSMRQCCQECVNANGGYTSY